MSTTQHNGQYDRPDPVGTPPGPDPTQLQSFVTPPKQKKLTWLVVTVGVFGLILGIMVGFAGGRGTTTTVTGTVSPQSCIEALDLADRGFQYAADLAYAAQDGFEAISQNDSASLAQANNDMISASNKIGGLVEPYNVAKAECRSTK